MTSILLASLLPGLILGASAHRAGLCTVKAVSEVLTTRRGWFLLSFAKAALWTMAILSVAGVFGFAPALRQWPLSGQALLGGVLFGLGAGANGSCSFSTLTRLADGHLAMLFTLLGWPAGMILAYHVFPDFHQMPLAASPVPGWLIAVLVPWMIWELWRIVRRFGHEGWAMLRAAHWPLSFSVAVIGGANAALLLLSGGWSFTSVLLCATGVVPLAGCQNPLSLGAISAAAMAGMVGSAVLRRSFRVRRIKPGAALRHGVSGVIMGAGAALIPGGNDGLILFGIPALSPQALLAWPGICLGIAVSLIILRAFGRPLMAIHCQNDICRASL